MDYYGVASTIFNTVVTIIISIYILLERNKILRFMKNLVEAVFKEKTSKAIGYYFLKGNDIFFKYISSQVIDAIIMGIICGIVMWIMGIKYGALLALMMGLFNMIPVIGSIVATAIVALITLFTGGISQAIWILVVITILQQIDANVINPRLIGSVLKLSPIIIIFSVTVFGAYYGILGMFLAVPIVAVMSTMLNDFIEYKKSCKQISKK